MSLFSPSLQSHHTKFHRSVAIAAATAIIPLSVTPSVVRAQHASQCTILCHPSLTFRPSLLVTHVTSRPKVRDLSSGAVHRLPSKRHFEMNFLLSAATELPRTSVYLSLQWLPNATAQSNPFTEYTASQLGSPIKANAPTVSAGASFAILPIKRTQGRLGVSAYAGDLYSEAAQPNDRSEYTHKLDVGLVATLGIFSGLPKHDWLHQVTGYLELDHVATGLPKRGDEVPQGERVFLTNAYSTSFLAGLSFPILPLTD